MDSSLVNGLFFLGFDINKTHQTSRTFLRILAVCKITVFCILPILISMPMSFVLFCSVFGGSFKYSQCYKNNCYFHVPIQSWLTLVIAFHGYSVSFLTLCSPLDLRGSIWMATWPMLLLYWAPAGDRPSLTDPVLFTPFW